MDESKSSSIRGERKQVTVMFVDIVRSMELTRSLENERWGCSAGPFLAIACGAIEELEGSTNQFTAPRCPKPLPCSIERKPTPTCTRQSALCSRPSAAPRSPSGPEATSPWWAATAKEAVAIAERRSLKRTVVLARLGLGRVLMATEGAAAGTAIEQALGGALKMATETGYRAIEPQVPRARRLARLRGDRSGAESEELTAERIHTAEK